MAYKNVVLDCERHCHLHPGRCFSLRPSTIRTHVASHGVRPLASSGSPPYVLAVQGGAVNSRIPVVVVVVEDARASMSSSNIPLVLLRRYSKSSRPTLRRCWRLLGPPSRALGAHHSNNNHTGSRLHPLRGDLDNPPPEGTNAIAQARTPQTRPSGPAREKNFQMPIFRLEGTLSGSRLPPPRTYRRHRIEPWAELLHLQKTHPSRNGLHAIPG